jgi:hypothetical protein
LLAYDAISGTPSNRSPFHGPVRYFLVPLLSHITFSGVPPPSSVM